MISDRKLFGKIDVLVLIFFCVYFLLGLRVYADYGVSVDERFTDDKAQLNLDYITGKSDKLLQYDDRFYGAILPIFVFEVGKLFPDSRDNLLMRHFVTFLIFYISSIYFYRLLRKIKFNPILALLGTAMYVFHPHIFSHSFYNIKDIPFLSIFVLNLYSLVYLIEKPGVFRAVLHGVVTGILIVFRMPGVFMVGITGLLGCWLLFTDRARWKQYLKVGVVYLMSSLATLYIFMPALWHDPFNELMLFFSGKLFVWDGQELFMGSFLTPAQYSWYYLPVFIGVTTPLLFTGLMIVGTAVILYDLLAKREFLESASVYKLIAFVSFYVPLAVLIITKPVIYNGWRHAFFIYPAFLMIGMIGLERLVSLIGGMQKDQIKMVLKYSLVGLFLLQAIELSVFFVSTHPFEHIYYNVFAGRTLAEARNEYCMDYWGLSYRKALEDLAKLDSSAQIKVSGPEADLLIDNIKILEPALRKRFLVLGEDEHPTYFINDFRYNLKVEKKNAKIVSTITLDGALISATYRFK